MRDWEVFIDEVAGSDIWGFVVLDYYFQLKKEGAAIGPSEFIDQILERAVSRGVDLMALHRSLLAVSVQLLGDDFEDVVGKSRRLLDGVRLSDRGKLCEAFVQHYGEYGRGAVAAQRLTGLEGGGDETKEVTMNSGRPRVFVSYSNDSEAHATWVRKLAEHLYKNGCDVRLDQWDLRLGDDLLQYMEKCVRESDRVLLVCTPNFRVKANEGKGGVGYEKGIVSGEVYHDAPERKFIPVLRSGDPSQSLPSYLKPILYIDFRRDEDFASRAEDLLRDILNSPRHLPPTPGPNPFSGRGT